MSEPPATPGWLLQPPVGLCSCGPSGRRTKASFLERTLRGGSDLLRQVMFTEDVAARPGLLQRLDPRAKLVGLLVLLVAASLVHHVLVLVGLYAVLLAVAAASGLGVGWFVKRVWLFIPVFTLVVVAPATFSFVTAGRIVVPLWTWDGAPVGLTAQGLTSAALVTSRVAVSISLVVLVTVTTTWTNLLGALRALGVPRMFVLVIAMAYRYIFLLLGSVTEMYQSREARSVGRVRHDRSARAFVGASAGATIGKAHTMADEVHQAMVARGYRGDAPTLTVLRFARADALLAVVVLALAVLTLVADHALGR